MSMPAPRRISLLLLVLGLSLWPRPSSAQDPIIPAEVEDVAVARNGADLVITWTPVTQDALGQPEMIDHYVIYRGTGPRFPEQFELAGVSTTPEFVDPGAGQDTGDYCYLITAVNDCGETPLR